MQLWSNLPTGQEGVSWLSSHVFCLLSLFCLSVSAQSGLTGFNYQAVVRNTDGSVLANQTVNLRFSLLKGSASGPATYVETRQLGTNAMGLFTHIIGRGTPVSGTFSAIDFAAADLYLKVGIDLEGGSNFQPLGTTELVAVPYALYAANGVPGPMGPQGIPGIQGAKGDKGDKGDMGAVGPKGDKGDTGAQGPKGDKGDPGPAGTVGWGLSGNAGTNPASDFIGTSDNQPLNIRVNNIRAGFISNSNSNTAWGTGALRDKDGEGNTAIGAYALSTHHFNPGDYNTATGFEALKNNYGNSNSATGSLALSDNIDGDDNTANGFQALKSNKEGDYNTAVGSVALSSNTTGNSNTAIGTNALHDNKFGDDNTALGFNALYNNLNGNWGTAIGVSALSSNVTGIYNTALGFSSVILTTSGDYNVGIGSFALLHNISGNFNTALGHYTDVTAGNFNNTTAIGNGAIVNASDKIVLGNQVVASIGGYAPWTDFSDGRYKQNVMENVPGLAFIQALRPVTYTLDIAGINRLLGAGNETEHRALARQIAQEKVRTGFIAQEVEAAAEKLGFDFSGVYRPQNPGDNYGLAYAQFVMPLVKAVQELAEKVEALEKENQRLKQQFLQGPEPLAARQALSGGGNLAASNRKNTQ